MCARFDLSFSSSSWSSSSKWFVWSLFRFAFGAWSGKLAFCSFFPSLLLEVIFMDGKNRILSWSLDTSNRASLAPISSNCGSLKIGGHGSLFGIHKGQQPHTANATSLSSFRLIGSGLSHVRAGNLTSIPINSIPNGCPAAAAGADDGSPMHPSSFDEPNGVEGRQT